MVRQTDATWLEQVLSDGERHSHSEILSRSYVERGCGLTVNSRAADLRKRGRVVTCTIHRSEDGRAESAYQMAPDRYVEGQDMQFSPDGRKRPRYCWPGEGCTR